MGVNTYTLSCEVEPVMNVDTIKKQLEVSLKCEKLNMEIRYTTDGSVPTISSSLYKNPIVVTDSVRINAASFKNGSVCSSVFTQNYYYHKGIGKSIKVNEKSTGNHILTDGYIGGYTYLDGSWFNFYGDRELTLDLGKEDRVNKVMTRWMQLRAGANRSLPESVELLLSDDGINYTSCGIVERQNIPNTPVLQFQNYDFEGSWTARYIRLRIKSGGSMSADEIIVL
jgi:hexosaminidase